LKQIQQAVEQKNLLAPARFQAWSGCTMHRAGVYANYVSSSANRRKRFWFAL